MNHKIKMPVLRPIPLDISGLPWYKRLLAYFSRRNWELMGDYELYIPWLDETWFIPKGFIFDGASVPRFLWPIINPTGVLLLGSLFHDFGYRYKCQLTKIEGKIIITKKGKLFFDSNFRKINNMVNGSYIMNGAAWFFLVILGYGWIIARLKNKDVEVDFNIGDVAERSKAALC